MGRLDDIIERNKSPRKFRKMRFPVGIMLSAFVLLILVLMIFTDLGVSPPPKQAPAQPSGEKRVDGIYIYRTKNTAGSGSVAPAAGSAMQPAGSAAH